ncbi:CBS domain-containing protein [Sporosarcina sp. PTS2304]|uniref:CBS domain-containing protein n=1 Tax=Sporosarcina sp. PTS2304 TaxID=2283194 RepID=UPI000E0E06C7|nr:CBS domain-containing protein [Sporosarcina sp. PTS2304]AXH99770.1 CBS domain-containing protein [Sporosarcina sp. PTS2304]
MQIIISHVNTDFDALASMIAAKKLYPDAQLVLSDKQESRVQRFLNIYRDMFDFIPNARVHWEEVTEMIIVDVASLARIGTLPKDFDASKIKIIVYDHHQPTEKDVQYDEGTVERTGAAVTLLLEEIQQRDLKLSSFEASLFGLGLYTDTGNFTYANTTVRDLQMASYLLETGMSLEMVQRYSEQTLTTEQQELLNELLAHTEIHEVDGLEIAVSTHEMDSFINGLALVTTKVLGVKGTDAAIAVVKMKNTVCVVGRANSERFTLLPLLKKLGGGGHKHAGSATVKKGDKEAILQEITENLDSLLRPAVNASELMTSPVKTITPDTTIEEAGRRMYRYGHSGYPIVENGKLVGLITRRDLDKANHHGLGHAPVKAYMTTNIITIEPTTSLEEIQELVIEHNIGRLPVIADGEIVGIVTRSNIIEVLYSDVAKEKKSQTNVSAKQLAKKMSQQLPEDICKLLVTIGEAASEMKTPVYLIGGIVRDILLGKPNNDIDIVAEGNGIQLAKRMQELQGGEVLEHENFGTATWTTPSGLSIDMTSSRLEYYEQPAALPQVETSKLGDDLLRRDFTINAMAIRLNEEAFGELIDPFGGQHDLQQQKIKILHNISFIEDPTRIFRAVRFEERFGFSMDGHTEKLALESIDKMIYLTPHRIIEEMKRLFTEGRPQKVVRRLFELHVWQQFGIHEKQLKPTVDAADRLHMLHSESAQDEPNWFEYFLLPFYYNQSLYAAEKFSLTKSRRQLLEEVQELDVEEKWKEAKTPGDFHRLVSDYSDSAILFMLAVDAISSHTTALDYLEQRRHIQHFLTGADLVKLGLKPGPAFSNILRHLAIEQLDGKVTSKAQAEQWLEAYVCKQS